MTSRENETQLTAMMRGLELYVIETSPARSEKTLAVLPEHLKHQVELERAGILFGAGPLSEEGSDIPVAGQIIIRAASFEDARRIADSDPFHAKGIRTYRLRRWRLNEGAIQATIRLSDQSVIFE